jgi:hypothetical protein
MSTNPNHPNRQEKKVPWESPFTGLVLPLLVGFLAFAGILFVFQMEYDRWESQPKIDLRHIPPELIAYRQTAVFATPVSGNPMSFALLGDSTFVIGSADPPMLSLFDETGTLLRTIDLPEEPRAIVCGTPKTIFADNIVVAHPKSIAVYHAEGNSVSFHELTDDKLEILGDKRSTSFRELNDKLDIRSLVLTPDYLFAADTGNRLIYRFDPSWHTLVMGTSVSPAHLSHVSRVFSQHAKPFDGFVVYASPITMTFSPADGLLYIANPGRHRVEVFTQDGFYQPELCWGEPSGSLSGFVGCCNPIDLAALDDGRILTVEKAIPRIKIFREGKLDCVVAGPGMLEEVPKTAGRNPSEPGGRYFTAVPLPNGEIAVFDDEYAVVRVFSR